MDSPENKLLMTSEVMEEIWELIKRESEYDGSQAAICPREIDGGYKYTLAQLKERQVDVHCLFIPWRTNMADAANVAQVWHIWFIDGQHNYKRIF